METLTTDKVGCKGLETVGAFTSQDAGDLFGIGGVDAGTGAGVGVGAGVDAVDKIPSKSGSPDAATMSCCVVPSEG